jgi:hypothetical protein
MFFFVAATLHLSTAGLLSADCPRRARLLDEDHQATILAQAVGPETSDESSAGPPGDSTAASLRQRMASLQASRPSLGAGIGLLAGGGGLVFGGVSVAYWGFLLQLVYGEPSIGVPSSSALPAALMIGGLVGVVAGVVLIIVGAILLTKAIRARKAASQEIKELRQQLRQIEGAVHRPTSVEATGPMLLVAEF